MKSNLTAIAALCLGALYVTPTADAAILSHTFDISGLPSEGDFASSFPTLTTSFGVPGRVIAVTFEINATMTEPSWSSELQIAVDTIDDVSFDGDIDISLWGGLNNSDPISTGGVLAASSFSSDGDVFLTLYEFLDDAPNPDAVYGSGSFVTVDFETRGVPDTGGTLALFACAIGAVGGVRRVQTNRRRA
ncbi:MAG: hypothetical protein ACKV19_08905 [Verrucomicrobiales bacterium]